MKTYRYLERIRVVYPDGVSALVGPALLSTLLQAKKIDKFERTDGWVELGIDPIRGMGGPRYEGAERRLN